MVQSSCLKITVVLLWLQFLWLPGTVQKCIFDDVQSSVSVVVPPSQSSRSASSRAVDSTPGFQVTQIAGKRSAQFGAPVTPARRRGIKRHVTLGAKPSRWGDFPAPLPIRIKTWTPQGTPTLCKTERERLEPAVSQAVAVVTNTLSVNRVAGPLLLSRDVNKFCRFLWHNSSVANYNKCGRANENYKAETCLGVTIPDEHLRGCAVYPHPDLSSKVVLRPDGEGLPETDLVLYLYAQSADRCHDTSVLAYAVHCHADRHGRPLAGVVVVCRDWLRGDGYSHARTVQTVIHELFHVLGFSKQLFSSWKDCSSPRRLGDGCSPWGHVTNIDHNGQVRIYTQSVVQAMQTHLGSSDAELGGPLENLGPHTFSSHWEARVLQGSIMTAALGNPELVRLDPVTLAALQDTGWYRVNQSAAQSLEWGRGQGEHFGSLTTCGDNSSTFFCTGSGSGCHYLHLHKGACRTDDYLDGCHIYKPSATASECWKEGSGRATEWSEEIYGSDSRCFFSDLRVSERANVSLSPGGSVQGRCYRHRCTGLNRYQLQVLGSDWVDCPAGTSIQVSGYRGSVLCPDNILCRHSQVAPPTSLLAPPHSGPPTNNRSSPERSRTLAAGFHFDSHQSSAKVRTLSSAERPLVAALAGALSLGLAAALLLAHRRRCSSRVRVHADPTMATA
ncbi:leishmanolysin-like peptidase [Arapaima gigas]